jgi:hypothetical protein
MCIIHVGFYAAQTYALFDRLTILPFLVGALGLATPVISLVSPTSSIRY